MFTLNIQVPNVTVEQQAPISVYYKVFAPNPAGRMVPTLIRNSADYKAKDRFLFLLSKSRSLILNITGQLGDKWVQIVPQTTLTFKNPGKLKDDVSDIVKQIMSQIAQDDNRDLYEKVSIDLIAINKDINVNLQEPDQEVSEISEDYESIPF